jgi:hypothetical protein
MTETTSAPAKAKGADNNKRLVSLEAGVSAIALALTANGISLEAGADPIEAAIGAIKTVAELREQVEALKAEVEELNKSIAVLEEAATSPNGDATAGEIAAIARAEAAEKRVVALELEVADLQVDVEELASAKNALANQLADDGKGTAPAAIVEEEPEPEPEPLVRPEGARDVPADLPSLTHVAIGALVNDGQPFEIVFSNGEYELVEFGSPPIEIPAAALNRVDGSRYIVGKAISIRGGQAPARIVGAGLFYRGEQVAFCAFEPAAVIQPGQERRFDRALIF